MVKLSRRVSAAKVSRFDADRFDLADLIEPPPGDLIHDDDGNAAGAADDMDVADDVSMQGEHGLGGAVAHVRSTLTK